MAFDEKSAERLRRYLADTHQVVERKMMGAVIFMVNGHMCCGITGDGLMVRVGPDAYEVALRRKYASPLDIGGGRTPRSFVVVKPDGFKTRKTLGSWVDQGLAFVGTLPVKVSKKPKK